MSEKSLWERVVELTIAVGERILAPVERFIGKRSLVGDATFFPEERFPWIAQVEANWETILDELETVLADREALPNFQDISKDQIEITDTTTGRLTSSMATASRRTSACAPVPRRPR